MPLARKCTGINGKTPASRVSLVAEVRTDGQAASCQMRLPHGSGSSLSSALRFASGKFFFLCSIYTTAVTKQLFEGGGLHILTTADTKAVSFYQALEFQMQTRNKHLWRTWWKQAEVWDNLCENRRAWRSLLPTAARMKAGGRLRASPGAPSPDRHRLRAWWQAVGN